MLSDDQTHSVESHEQGGVGLLVWLVRGVEEDAFRLEVGILCGVMYMVSKMRGKGQPVRD